MPEENRSPRPLTEPDHVEDRILRTLLSLDREGRLRPPATSPEVKLIERILGLEPMEAGDRARLGTGWRKVHFENPPRLLLDAELEWGVGNVEWSWLLRRGYVQERQPHSADAPSWPKSQLADYQRDGKRVWALRWSPYVRADDKLVFCLATVTEAEPGRAWSGVIEAFVDGQLRYERVFWPGAYFPHVRCELTEKAWDYLETRKGETPEEGGGMQETSADQTLSLDARALALLLEHPDWTVKKIAETLGCHRGSLYDCPLFQKAREAQKLGREEHLPRGYIDKDTQQPVPIDE